MSDKRLGKKANLFDIPFQMIGMVVFGIIILIGGTSLFFITNAFQENELTNVPGGINVTEKIAPLTNSFFPMFDWIFLLGFIMIWIICYIGAFLIRTNPLFTGIGILFLIITIFISAFVSNVFNDIVSASPSISGIVPGQSIDEVMPLMFFTLNNLPFLVMILGGLAVIILYAKKQEGQ